MITTLTLAASKLERAAVVCVAAGPGPIEGQAVAVKGAAQGMRGGTCSPAAVCVCTPLRSAYLQPAGSAQKVQTLQVSFSRQVRQQAPASGMPSSTPTDVPAISSPAPLKQPRYGRASELAFAAAAAASSSAVGIE